MAKHEATYQLNHHVDLAGQKRPESFGYILSLIFGIIILAATMVIAYSQSLGGFSDQIFHFFNNWPDTFKPAALIITEALGAAYPIAACVVIPLLFRKFYLSWRFLCTAGGAFVLAEIVKKIVGEPRPYKLLHGHIHQRAIETGPGFPSGHEAAATALALTLWLILPWKWRWLSIVWMVVVAFSRLYLGVHMPADVLGGFACGLVAIGIVGVLPKFLAKWLRLENSKILD
ncbi:MAG: phosphatase PAP2 family protein [Candidatus Saccharimonadales bacterium]